MDEILLLLRRSGRRIRVRDGLRLAQGSLWIAAALATIIMTIGRFFPIEYLLLWSTTPLIIWLIFVLIVPLLQTLTPLNLARRIDHELDLKQRVSTAIALAEAKRVLEERYSENLVAAQRQDALIHLRQIEPKHDFPLEWQRRPMLFAGGLILCVIILAFIPNPMEAIIAHRHQIAQETEQQAKEIEELRKEIEAAEELSPELKEELLRHLAELAEALRANPGDLEDTLAEISRLEMALQDKLDPSAAAQAANLSALMAQLAALSGQEPRTDEETLEAAMQALDELAENLENISSEDRAQLSQSLAQMAASASQSGNPKLAQALSALSQAVAAGDPMAASQSAAASQAAIAQTAQALNDQAMLEAALSQLNASSQALAQAGRPIAGPSTANNPGNNPASSPGNGQGQPSGPTSGGGTRADSLPPAQGQGRPGAPQGQAVRPVNPGPQEQIYAPRQTGTWQGDPLFISGADTGQGETIVSEGDSPLPGAVNPALVPYDQVYYDYLQAANQAVNQIAIPASLQAYVREYFSQLEP